MRATAHNPQLVKSPQVKNRLLASLPPDEYERLLPHLEPINLPGGKVLHHAGDIIQYAHFVDDGLISLRSTTADGTSIAVACTGNEGVIGIPLVLRSNTTAYEVVAQVPVTSGTRVTAEVLRDEFDRRGKLHEMILRYTHLLMTQFSQAVICNQFHSSEQRLARSLLVSLDVSNSDTVNLTHDDIAHMLGTRRTRITMAARSLQKGDLIGYSRGKITLRNRSGLEKSACECYKILKENFDHFISVLQ